jgi:Zn-dependent protease with chaperone function
MIPHFTIHSVPWFDRLLWAGGHSLWQGALAAGIVWVCGRFIASARAKHMLAWTALLCLLAMFVASFALAPRTVIEVNGVETEAFEYGAMGGAMWVASFAALASLIVLRFCSLLRIIRKAAPVSMETNQALIEAAEAAGGPAGRPNTMICAKIATPAATHDRVLLPADCLQNLDARELASVIAHENAHLKRGDFWLNVGQNFLEAALIFNPFAWYLSARIRVEREHCCDDDAVAVTGDVVAYGRALAKLAVGRELQPALAIAMADARVSHRIRRLSTPRRASRGGAWVPLIAVGASVIAFGLFAQTVPHDTFFSRPVGGKSLTIRMVNFREVKGEEPIDQAVQVDRQDVFYSSGGFVTATASSSSSSSSSTY